MKTESTLAKMISTAGEKAAYDRACKRLLANKIILAWIMKSCLGDADDGEATGILRLLEVLLSTERSTEEKKKILQEDFDIEMTQELEREVSEMCNLSDGIEQKTILSAIKKLMSSTGWNIAQAMDALQIPIEERNGYLNMLKK